MKLSVFHIWREATGGFYLKQGDAPLTQGDVCFKRLECETWDQATAELHRFMDQRAKDGLAT